MKFQRKCTVRSASAKGSWFISNGLNLQESFYFQSTFYLSAGELVQDMILSTFTRYIYRSGTTLQRNFIVRDHIYQRTLKFGRNVTRNLHSSRELLSDTLIVLEHFYKEPLLFWRNLLDAFIVIGYLNKLSLIYDFRLFSIFTS